MRRWVGGRTPVHEIPADVAAWSPKNRRELRLYRQKMIEPIGIQQFNGCEYFLDIQVRSAYTSPVKINTYQKNKRRDSLGGRTIAIEPTNSRTIYAGAPKGGVF